MWKWSLQVWCNSWVANYLLFPVFLEFLLYLQKQLALLMSHISFSTLLFKAFTLLQIYDFAYLHIAEILSCQMLSGVPLKVYKCREERVDLRIKCWDWILAYSFWYAKYTSRVIHALFWRTKLLLFWQAPWTFFYPCSTANVNASHAGIPFPWQT